MSTSDAIHAAILGAIIVVGVIAVIAGRRRSLKLDPSAPQRRWWELSFAERFALARGNRRGQSAADPRLADVALWYGRSQLASAEKARGTRVPLGFWAFALLFMLVALASGSTGALIGAGATLAATIIGEIGLRRELKSRVENLKKANALNEAAVGAVSPAPPLTALPGHATLP